jgi:hypothetical protein
MVIITIIVGAAVVVVVFVLFISFVYCKLNKLSSVWKDNFV